MKVGQKNINLVNSYIDSYSYSRMQRKFYEGYIPTDLQIDKLLDQNNNKANDLIDVSFSNGFWPSDKQLNCWFNKDRESYHQLLGLMFNKGYIPNDRQLNDLVTHEHRSTLDTITTLFKCGFIPTKYSFNSILNIDSTAAHEFIYNAIEYCGFELSLEQIDQLFDRNSFSANRAVSVYLDNRLSKNTLYCRYRNFVDEGGSPIQRWVVYVIDDELRQHKQFVGDNGEVISQIEDYLKSESLLKISNIPNMKQYQLKDALDRFQIEVRRDIQAIDKLSVMNNNSIETPGIALWLKDI